MGKNIAYFAADDDDHALRTYMDSIGLALLPGSLDLLDQYTMYPPPDDSTMGGVLSFRPIAELHPYGSPPVKLCDATDPLLDFTRGYYKAPYLVAGCISWSSDTPEFAMLTKSYFTKLARWVRGNWTKRSEDGYYIGPSALRLSENPETVLTYFPPNVTIEYRG